MNDAIWLKLIDQLPAIIAALASLVTAAGVIIVYRKQNAAVAERKVLTETVDKLAVGINGQSTQLQKVTKALGFAEGEQAQKVVQAAKDESFAAGVKEEKERQL